jgi:hypothetical protein
MANDATIKIDLATEFTGKKAFSSAEKATQKLTKGVKSLASAFGIAFGARAIGMYSKKAVNAFAADEKAARSLALQLKNTGNAFAAPQVEAFIANLQKTTGVLDDSLRPAFQTLITATGDVALSQKALGLALDISAGTGKDLGAVSIALAKGFGGQTTALSRLGAGLDKATLASGDMDKITTILTGKFKGQALEAVKGYAGQMALLQVASQNSAEIIGQGLLDAVSLLGKDNSVANLANDMERVATQTANVIRGIGVLIAKIKSIPGLSTLSKLVGETSLAGQAVGALGKLGASTQPKGYGSSNSVDQFVQAGGKLTAVTKKLTATQLAALAAANAKAKADKDAAALEELKKKFDVERINLSTALANATTDEERARIASKIAILDGDAKAAASLNKLSNAQLYTADQMYYLAVMAGDAAAMLKYLATGSGSGGAVYGPGTIGATNLPVGSGGSATSDVFNLSNMPGTIAPQGGIGGMTINQYVEGGLVDGERIVDLVQEALQVLNARGYSQFKSGALQTL